MALSGFTKDRLSELKGFLLLLLAAFNAVSFLSYNPFDPSLNYATSNETTNMGGNLGAFIADPLLQMFGLGSFALVLVPLVWGFKIIRKRKIKLISLKIFILLIAVISLSALSSLFDTPETWPFEKFGGYIGTFVSDRALIYVSIPAFTLIATTIAFLSMYFVLSVSFYGFIETGIAAYKYTRAAIEFIYDSILRSWYFFAGNESENIKKPRKPSKRKEPEISRYKGVSDYDVRQDTLDLKIPEKFQLPSINLLSVPPKQKKNNVTEAALSQNARILERVLEDFGVLGKISKISPGPVVTLYELEPSPGTKSSRVIGLADDISRSMSSVSARIAVIPGRNAIGIELPNTERETVFLRELLETEEYKGSENKLALALGKNIAGGPEIVDLARMPHLLVAGTTGSGKSVAINTMILSLLYKYTPDECKFIMIDPKMLELSIYDGIPNLLSPVVTEPKKAIVALKWTVKEMENRYRLMSNLGVRNVAGYNKRIEIALKEGEVLSRSVQTGFETETGKPIIEQVPINMVPLPYIVVVVDEMADLMLVAGKEIESSIQRLAQMARAAGIHLIMPRSARLLMLLPV